MQAIGVGENVHTACIRSSAWLIVFNKEQVLQSFQVNKTFNNNAIDLDGHILALNYQLNFIT